MRATATAHPNFALIKYWGKRDSGANVPAVGSLSVTLDAMSTTTTVSFDEALGRDTLELEGREVPASDDRLRRCMDALRDIAGIDHYAAISSRNDFPTGAGLASSASGYAALIMAAAGALRLDPRDPRLLDIARIGSGSAPRSVCGGYALLEIDGDRAVCGQCAGAEDWPLGIVVAITDEAAKDVSSRDGMERSRSSSPFYDQWVRSHPADLSAAAEKVASRDFAGLAVLAEHNCLKMHAVMMTTQPPLLYWKPATIDCMREIMRLRAEGLPVFFTVDAGPQVKAVCQPEAVEDVRRALESIPGVGRTVSGGVGGGARIVATDADG